MSSILDAINFNDQGLVPAIAIDANTNEPLMMAWMNRESVERTIQEGKAIYFSRSRNTLWRKGESSGNEQIVKALFLDCDGDTLLLKVEQNGVACHTGRRSCFYRQLVDGQWRDILPVEMDPAELYRE